MKKDAENQMIGIADNRNARIGNQSFEFDMANFLASSVHDMKNSMNMLLVSLDKTLASADAAKLSTHAELVRMSDQAKRVNNKLTQLLTLYKLGQQVYPLDVRFVCLQDFVSAIIAQYGDLLAFRGICLEAQVSPQLCWYFDEDLIENVIGNALNNAIHYARNRIRIQAVEKAGKLLLRIEDDGEGYPDLMLQKNGNPVQRPDCRRRSTGLGLYFSAMVARMHQNRNCSGELKLENGGSLGGACFILYLP